MQAQPDAHRSRTARRPYAATSGAMLAAIPVPWAVACWAHGGAFGHFPAWVVGILATGTLALGAAGFALPLRARLGRVLATVGVLSLPALAAPRLWQSPGLTLLLALVAVVTLGALWGFGSALLVPRLHRGPLGSARVRSSAAVALIFWLAVENVRDHPTTAELVTVGASMLIALGLGVAWILRTWRRSGARTRILSGGVLATASLSAVTWSDPWSLVGSGAVYAVIAAVFGPRTSRSDSPQGSWWAGLLEHPERMLVTTFAIMAAVGTLVLALPQSSATGTGVGVLDAAFTAVSAVCVTGLVVLDTPTDFSPVGHVAILALMQLGGLGIMTFSTAALRMLGRRLSLREESAVARLIGTKDRSRLITSAQDVLRITFVVEGAGALLLTILFLAHGDDLADALWRGVFTAVSAFCNAGFAMQSDSLVPYQHAPLVLHVVALLIVVGGLSPAVILALASLRTRPARPLSVQVRMCLVAAAALLVTGFAFFLVSEWDSSLAGLSLADKLHNAWFQSVTLRTAGFNSVDIAAVHPATWFMMLAFMFVGGSPGGTAGGIKTTTAGVLLLSVFHTIRGSSAVTAFGRRIPEQTIQRASVIAIVGVAGIGIGTLALLLTQQLPLTAVVFEVVSALGTVGLSVGATGELDEIGRIIVLACMFVGRVGGLSLMMLMTQRANLGDVRLPLQDIDVG